MLPSIFECVGKQTVAFISTDTYNRISVTYFQFQIPILVFFCTVIEVK